MARRFNILIFVGDSPRAGGLWAEARDLPGVGPRLGSAAIQARGAGERFRRGLNGARSARDLFYGGVEV